MNNQNFKAVEKAWNPWLKKKKNPIRQKIGVKNEKSHPHYIFLMLLQFDTTLPKKVEVVYSRNCAGSPEGQESLVLTIIKERALEFVMLCHRSIGYCTCVACDFDMNKEKIRSIPANAAATSESHETSRSLINIMVLLIVFDVLPHLRRCRIFNEYLAPKYFVREYMSGDMLLNFTRQFLSRILHWFLLSSILVNTDHARAYLHQSWSNDW